MGNQSSRSSAARSRSVRSVSKPHSLAADYHAPPLDPDSKDAYSSRHTSISRHASARAASPSPLSGPSHGLLAAPAVSHRRSRSALAGGAQHNSRSRPGTPLRDSLAPPPYAAAVAESSSARMSAPERTETLRRPMRQSSVEDALDTLRKFNTVIVVDDSGSMAGARWREARDALASLADIAAKYDADGIDICFLNSTRVGTNMKDSELIRRLFDSVTPSGPTPIGEKLEELLLYYLDYLDRARARADAGDDKAMRVIRPVNYIVITDGAPTDDPETVIVTAARRLDEGRFPLTQVGIQFVQIGDSADATAFLDELDNGLSEAYHVRDIVDTTPFRHYAGTPLNAEMIIKILLGGINRRVDRRGAQSVL